MRSFAMILALVAVGAAATPAFAVSANVRISQVYGAGGNAGAVYDQDFVELFNFSSAVVSLAGWSLQYGAATGSNTTGLGTCTNCLFAFPAGAVIQPCGYYLVGFAAGMNGAPLPVVPDAIGATGLGATAGKVALVAATAASGVCPPAAGTLVDLVGYGAAATCAETTPTATLTVTTAILRGGDGMTDTDNNAVDFATGAPAPRAGTSPRNANCQTVPAAQGRSWGLLKATFR